MQLEEAMRRLEKAGSAQTRKTWQRHGAKEPMFGVKFSDLGALVREIDTDHALAVALWGTGNHDARQLAVMIDDASKTTRKQLDAWVRETRSPMLLDAIAGLAAETPHAADLADAWRAAGDEWVTRAGWMLVSKMGLRVPGVPDAWFRERLDAIPKAIGSAPNRAREAMLHAMIGIGARTAALRKRALAVAAKVGKVEIDHGDTSCKTPDVAGALEKAWDWSLSKGFASPAEQEQKRKRPKGSGCAR